MTNTKLIIASMAALLLAGCGGSKKGEQTDTDSIAEIQADGVADSFSVKPTIYITKDSVGAIAVNMSVNDVPDSVEGLYAKKVNGASQDAVTITFSDPEGEKFVAYDFGEGKIDVINVIGNGVKVKAPKGEFGLGDKFSKVLELPGVEAEWSGYEGTGSWYWVWEGLWFAPSQETLTETLSRRLYYSGSEPTVTDFGDDVLIGFIGTGLPF